MEGRGDGRGRNGHGRDGRGASGRAPDEPPRPSPTQHGEPFRIDGVLLLAGGRDDPIAVDGITLVFGEDGVGVARGDPSDLRVLPWSSLATHVVEPWSGGLLPEWWVDPELNRAAPLDSPASDGSLGEMVIDPSFTNRPFPHTEPGALISLKTPFATYRFLKPGGDATQLAPRIAALALANAGPAGAPSATTALARPPADEPARSRWRRVQPVLVVLLLVLIAAAVTLILLQSAGVIHLRILGGSGSAARAGTALRIR